MNYIYISHTTIGVHKYEHQHHVYYYGNSIAIVLLFKIFEEDITGII